MNRIGDKGLLSSRRSREKNPGWRSSQGGVRRGGLALGYDRSLPPEGCAFSDRLRGRNETDGVATDVHAFVLATCRSAGLTILGRRRKLVYAVGNKVICKWRKIGIQLPETVPQGVKPASVLPDLRHD